MSGPDAVQLTHGHQRRSWLWALAATLLVLGLVYAPNFRDLSWYWFGDPNYSHGPLVIPIAAIILWRRLSTAKAKLTPNASATAYWGWVLLAGVLGLRVIAYERNTQWSENATLLPAIACLTWIFGGWSLLRLAWPAIVFLLFMFPLPQAVNSSISLPLQEFATAGSCFLLQLSHIWVVQQGNTIHLTTKTHEIERLEVAAACNGLSMLMTLAATVTATIIVIPLPTWKRITVLVSAVPIALVSNILRIVATGWCYYYIPGPKAKEWAHDISGWLMMPLALVLIGLELRILSWLVPKESSSDDEHKVILAALTETTKVAQGTKTRSKDKESVILPALIDKKKKAKGEFDEL
jgi:exosortase